jgi:hypothetical protein
MQRRSAFRAAASPLPARAVECARPSRRDAGSFGAGVGRLATPPRRGRRQAKPACDGAWLQAHRRALADPCPLRRIDQPARSHDRSHLVRSGDAAIDRRLDRRHPIRPRRAADFADGGRQRRRRVSHAAGLVAGV